LASEELCRYCYLDFMKPFETDLRSLRLNWFWYHRTECLHGALLAAAAYLFVCVGPGIIPWKVADYFVYLGAIGVCMSAVSIAKDHRWNWTSLIPPAVLAPFYLLFLFGFGFVAGLPGTEWTTRGAVTGFFLFPLTATLIQIVQNPRSISIISLAFLFAIIVGGTGLHVVSTYAIQKEISLTLTNGGCVFSTGDYDTEPRRAISSVADVKIGIVSMESDRMYFIIGPAVRSWSYSKIETVRSNYFDKEMVSDCENKKGGISATP
jgi:hypothetical protein